MNQLPDIFKIESITIRRQALGLYPAKLGQALSAVVARAFFTYENTGPHWESPHFVIPFPNFTNSLPADNPLARKARPHRKSGLPA